MLLLCFDMKYNIKQLSIILSMLIEILRQLQVLFFLDIKIIIDYYELFDEIHKIRNQLRYYILRELEIDLYPIMLIEANNFILIDNIDLYSSWG